MKKISEQFSEIESNSELKDEILEQSLEWLNDSFRGSFNTESPIETAKQEFSDDMESTATLGHIYHYLYYPKTKVKYYDKFPLTLVIKKYSDGFLGLNFHYLSVKYRFALMSQLWDHVIAEKGEVNNNSYIRVRYETLNSIGSIKYYKPCLKRYSYKQLLTPLFRIPAEKWLYALMLPTERFFTLNKTYLSRENIHRITRTKIY